MKITVETTKEVWRTGEFHGPPAIRISVKVDGQEELGLSQALSEAEMQSHFDILWEYLGEKIKEFNKKRKGVNNAETHKDRTKEEHSST